MTGVGSVNHNTSNDDPADTVTNGPGAGRECVEFVLLSRIARSATLPDRSWHAVRRAPTSLTASALGQVLILLGIRVGRGFDFGLRAGPFAFSYSASGSLPGFFVRRRSKPVTPIGRHFSEARVIAANISLSTAFPPRAFGITFIPRRSSPNRRSGRFVLRVRFPSRVLRPAPLEAGDADRPPLLRSPSHRREHQLEHCLPAPSVRDHLHSPALLAEQAFRQVRGAGRLAVPDRQMRDAGVEVVEEAGRILRARSITPVRRINPGNQQPRHAARPNPPPSENETLLRKLPGKKKDVEECPHRGSRSDGTPDDPVEVAREAEIGIRRRVLDYIDAAAGRDAPTSLRS